VADPSQPKNRLIRPLVDSGGSAVGSLLDLYVDNRYKSDKFII
jgi:hypothetical protein